MTQSHNPSEIQERLQTFKPEDIKILVLRDGKVTDGQFEFTLKDLPPQDPTLQAIIDDPHFEVRPIGEQTKSNEMYYDLKTIDRQVRVRVICQKK